MVTYRLENHVRGEFRNNENVFWILNWVALMWFYVKSSSARCDDTLHKL